MPTVGVLVRDAPGWEQFWKTFPKALNDLGYVGRKLKFARDFEPSVPLGEKRSFRNASIRELHRAAYRGGRKRYRRGRPSGSRRSDHSNTATASELQVRPGGLNRVTPLRLTRATAATELAPAVMPAVFGGVASAPRNPPARS